MTVCLFCSKEIPEEGVGIGSWHGHPTHLSCSDWITESISDFEPILVESHPRYQANHDPVTYGYAGMSLQDCDYEWPKLEESLKEKLYRKYIESLNAMLDYQEVVIRAYCKRHGLPEPKIIRELKQNTQHMVEVYRLMEKTDILPGDHLVMAVLPRSQRHRHRSAQLTVNIARRMASMGVTFHSAHVGLDWSKPVAQAAVRLAVKTQVWQNTIFKDQIDNDPTGHIKRLYGYTWGQIQRHQLFQWVVRHIRDKKMSPAEVWNASRRYWSVHAFNYFDQRYWCLMITKDKYLAWEKRKQNHYCCQVCKQIMTKGYCQLCAQPCRFVKVQVVQGCHLNLRRKWHEDEEMYMQMWAWYLEKTPEQERQPWLGRSRFPEILELRDVTLENAENDMDKL